MCIILLCTSLAHAQPRPPVRFEPSPLMPPLTDDRPAVTDWLASVSGTGLTEGRLELHCTADNQSLGTMLSEELVISGQEQKVRIILPPLNWSAGTSEITVHMRWLGKDGEWNLPTQLLRTALKTARKFPVLIGETPQRPRAARNRDPLADRLRFESLLPEELKDHAVTIIHHQLAPGFPQDPLALCQYEVIAIADDVFAALRSAQLEAIVQWVRAGGSLYLEPEGVLEPSHVMVLNRLVADEPDRPTFVVDEQGRLPLTTLPDNEGTFTARCGLGTVVLYLADENVTISAPGWNTVAATLWRIRPKFAALARDGGLTYDAVTSQLGVNLGNQATWTMSGPPQELMEALRPEGVKLVPLWLIGTLLGLLVLLIGPFDFLVLSSIRRRKWTWITFPVCVVLMTGVLVTLTNAYLSSSEARRALILHDVAPDGEIVRTNRFELVFASATRQLETDLRSALFAPLKKGGALLDEQYRWNQMQATRMQSLGYLQGSQQGSPFYSTSLVMQFELEPTDPVSVSGRVPGRYTVSQKVTQWTPQLNRKFSIGPPEDATPVNWKMFEEPVVRRIAERTTPDYRATEFQTQIQQQFGSDAQAIALTPDGTVWTSASLPGVDFRFQSIVQRMTVTERHDISRLLSQTSPHGGRTLDDVPLGVGGGGDRWWLVVIVPQGDDVLVYRRSYAYSH